MIWQKSRFQYSWELLPQVFQQIWLPLVSMEILLFSLNIYIQTLNQDHFNNLQPKTSLFPLVSLTLLYFTLTVLCSVAWTLLVAGSTQNHMKNGLGQRIFPFAHRHFHQTLIENLRASLHICLGFLALVIPGGIQWVRLNFTPYVVAFDTQYQKGQKDALKTSGSLVQGHGWTLFLFLILQSFLPNVLEELSLGPLHFVSGLFFKGLSFIIQIYFLIYMTLTYFALSSLKNPPPPEIKET